MTESNSCPKINSYVSLDRPCPALTNWKSNYKNRNTLISEVDKLANIKSAKKRILVNRTKAARNKSIRSAVKTSIKKVETAVQKNDKAAAQAALTEAISTISKATSKGVYHKNNCARKISRLSKAVNSIG